MLCQLCSSMLAWKEQSVSHLWGHVLSVLKTSKSTPRSFSVLFTYLHINGFCLILLLGIVAIYFGTSVLLGNKTEKTLDRWLLLSALKDLTTPLAVLSPSAFFPLVAPLCISLGGDRSSFRKISAISRCTQLKPFDLYLHVN